MHLWFFLIMNHNRWKYMCHMYHIWYIYIYLYIYIYIQIYIYIYIFQMTSSSHAYFPCDREAYLRLGCWHHFHFWCQAQTNSIHPTETCPQADTTAVGANHPREGGSGKAKLQSICIRNIRLLTLHVSQLVSFRWLQALTHIFHATVKLI